MHLLRKRGQVSAHLGQELLRLVDQLKIFNNIDHDPKI